MNLHQFSVCLSSAALLLLAAAAPASAANPAPSPSNQASIAHDNGAPAHSAKPQAEEPKKICRTIGTSSSRLQSKKVCMTRQQWRDTKYR